MRYLLTFVVVALSTAGVSLWWLHDGNVAEVVGTSMPSWDATTLARDAGVPADAVPETVAAPEVTPEPPAQP